MKVKKAMKKWLLPAIAVILVLSYCHIAYSNITYEYFRFRDYLRLRKEISLCSSYFLDNYENYISLLTAEIPPDCVLPSDRLQVLFVDSYTGITISSTRGSITNECNSTIDDPEVTQALAAISRRMREHKNYYLEFAPKKLPLTHIYLDATEVLFWFGFMTPGDTWEYCGSGLSYVSPGSEPHICNELYDAWCNSFFANPGHYRHLIGDWYLAKQIGPSDDWHPRGSKDFLAPFNTIVGIMAAGVEVLWNLLFVRDF